jgi:toxin ParE1/3/4
MTYRVIPSIQAEKDILAIVEYILHESNCTETTQKILNTLNKQIKSLDTMPKRFALVADERLAQKGFRLMPVKNYIIFYVVEEQSKTVNIVSVLHNKRDWINLL